MNQDEWNKKYIEFWTEWDNLFDKYKGKFFCSHEWGEPPQIVWEQMPKERNIKGIIDYPNGVKREVETEYEKFFWIGSYTFKSKEIVQCGKCGKLKVLHEDLG